VSGAPITREQLVTKLQGFGVLPKHRQSFNDDELAEPCTELCEVLVGQHDGKNVTAARAYLILTGRRLKL
jgi:hypothetical protein